MENRIEGGFCQNDFDKISRRGLLECTDEEWYKRELDWQSYANEIDEVETELIQVRRDYQLLEEKYKNLLKQKEKKSEHQDMGTQTKDGKSTGMEEGEMDCEPEDTVLASERVDALQRDVG